LVTIESDYFEEPVTEADSIGLMVV